MLHGLQWNIVSKNIFNITDFVKNIFKEFFSTKGSGGAGLGLTVVQKNDPRVQYPQAAAKEGIVAMLSIPIKCRETIIGVIRIYHNEPIIIHNEDIETLCVMSRNLGQNI